MVVWMTGHVESVYVEGCGGSTSDVCPVSWMKNEDDEIETDAVGRMVVSVEEKLESEVVSGCWCICAPLGHGRSCSRRLFLLFLHSRNHRLFDLFE